MIARLFAVDIHLAILIYSLKVKPYGFAFTYI